MKIFALWSMWILAGGTTSFIAVIGDSDIWVKAVTFLCGLLTILFSLTFAAMLKHFSAHSNSLDKYRVSSECELMRKECQTSLGLKLDAISGQLQKLDEKVHSHPSQNKEGMASPAS